MYLLTKTIDLIRNVTKQVFLINGRHLIIIKNFIIGILQ